MNDSFNNISALQLMQERHSVRQYKQKLITSDKKALILEFLQQLRETSGLDIRFVENSKKVFGGLMMKFIGWKNPPTAYFAFVGDKTPELQEKCGYYGEQLVLFLQSIGLNTCWVGMFQKSSSDALVDGNTIITIAVGYGMNNGVERKTKSVEQVSEYVCDDNGDVPRWFTDGVKYALLAPTAINRQAFLIVGKDNKVFITYTNGPFSNVDIGIVKYHFEQGAGKENFEFVNTRA